MEITRKGPPIIRLVPEEYPPEINELLSLLAPFLMKLKQQLKDEVKAEVLNELTGLVKTSTPAIISDWHFGPIVEEVVPTQPVVLPGIVPIQIPEAAPAVPPAPTPEPVIEVTPEPVIEVPPEPVVVPEPVEETVPEPPPAPWTQPGDPPPPQPPPEKPKRGRKPTKVKVPKLPRKGGRPATYKSDTESAHYKCRKSWAQANLLRKNKGLPPIPKAEFEAAYYLKHPPETGQVPKTEPVAPAPLEDG
jgi:hypothetical protein